ncbi:hypothetical protein LTR85_011910 [Meristemomyces frigidus]|nr:hypothetical protein LTR85_011910 [Meristemomyces frigidus]
MGASQSTEQAAPYNPYTDHTQDYQQDDLQAFLQDIQPELFLITLASEEGEFDYDALLVQYTSLNPLVVLDIGQEASLDTAHMAYLTQVAHINPERAPEGDFEELHMRIHLLGLLNVTWDKVLAKPWILTRRARRARKVDEEGEGAASQSARQAPDFPSHAARFLPKTRKRDATGWTALSMEEEQYGVAINGSMRVFH